MTWMFNEVVRFQHFSGPSADGMTDLWYQGTIRSDLKAVSQEIQYCH